MTEKVSRLFKCNEPMSHLFQCLYLNREKQGAHDDGGLPTGFIFFSRYCIHSDIFVWFMHSVSFLRQTFLLMTSIGSRVSWTLITECSRGISARYSLPKSTIIAVCAVLAILVFLAIEFFRDHEGDGGVLPYEPYFTFHYQHSRGIDILTSRNRTCFLCLESFTLITQFCFHVRDDYVFVQMDAILTPGKKRCPSLEKSSLLGYQSSVMYYSTLYTCYLLELSGPRPSRWHRSISERCRPAVNL